jgi:hypothetical protein
VLRSDEISVHKKELGQKKNSNDMLVALGDKLPSYSTVKKWVARFGTGNF